ncbi:MAG: hypothetical protein ACJA2W_000034 [Planctomycetota bacterium]|jgi:hypothetical protein
MPPIQRAEAELPPEVLEHSIQGQNLAGAASFGELLKKPMEGTSTAQPTLIAFLRHFG